MRVGNGLLSSQYSLYLRDQLDNNIEFTANGATSQSFVICSTNTTTVGTIKIPVSAVGNTMAQYILNTNSINVTISQPVPPTPPTFDNDTKFEGSSGTINIVSKRTGKVVVKVSEDSSKVKASRISNVDTKAVSSSSSSSVSSNLDYIYENPTDTR